MKQLKPYEQTFKYLTEQKPQAFEKRQSEISLHFIVLGGLRYTHKKLLEIIERSSMLTYEHIKGSFALQALLIKLFQIKTQKAFLQRLAELAAIQPTTPKRVKKNGTSKK